MENELYHYGRKGMKWYQRIFTKGKEARAKKKNEQMEKDRENAEEYKKAIRNSRSAKQVYDNAHLFTDKELNEIYQRLNTENNIKNLIPEKVNKGKKFVEGISNTAKTVGTLAGNIGDAHKKITSLFEKLNGNKADSAGKGKTDGNKADKADKASKSKEQKEKVYEGVVEDIPGFNKSKTSSSTSRSKPIIDVYGEPVNDNITALARSMTSNIGSRTVSWAMNNQPRIESGANFASNLLALPAPKDD